MIDDILPAKNSDYSTQEYWEQRYQNEAEEEMFDWFKSYADLKPIIRELVPCKTSVIINLGCGNSTFPEDLYDDGYTEVLSVDFSPAVIDKMKRRRPEMKWEVMDIKNMSTIPDNSIDVAIDKGTLDALISKDGNSWSPEQKTFEAAKAEIDEVVRVLKPGGMMIYISFGQPHFRKRFLEHDQWMSPGIELKRIGEAFHYFIYIMRKVE